MSTTMDVALAALVDVMAELNRGTVTATNTQAQTIIDAADALASLGEENAN